MTTSTRWASTPVIRVTAAAISVASRVVSACGWPWPYPAVDQHRIRGYAVGVDPVGGQLVEDDVDIGAGHVIDLRMNAADLTASAALTWVLSVAAVVVRV